MIAVLADDITGAAELAGIGLRYQLAVEVCHEADHPVSADLLVVFTNTRSLPEEEAIKEVQKSIRQLQGLQPDLIYKKIDSVLRGHVAAELEAEMEVLQTDKALVVPANPSLGRTIVNGVYYVQGKPVHETGFSSDPEFPITHSHIKDMVRKLRLPILVAQPGDAMNEPGIYVGEAGSEKTLVAWAGQKDASFILAGGSGFFTALLDTYFSAPEKNSTGTFRLNEPLLLVSGTSFKKSVQYRKELEENGMVVKYLPEQNNQDIIEAWTSEVAELVGRRKQVFIARSEMINEKKDPRLLTQEMAEAVFQVFAKCSLRELFIEGGATAYAIIRRLGFSRFFPTEELAPGVIRMRVDGAEDLHLTIKPGSYGWPHLSNLTKQ
jgi:D-threonate/D-erythronate kinase